MGSLLYRTAVSAAVLVLSAVLFLPNVLEQDLEITFREYNRNEEGVRVPVTSEQIHTFLTGGERGLPSFFPDKECVSAVEGKSVEESFVCRVRERFITSARVNEVVQSHPELIDESRTKILPHPIESFFSFLSYGDFKNLVIRLGLDLQGGMRATFRADFDTYIERLKEKYEPVLKELNGKLANEKTPESEKADLEARKLSIEELLTLSETRKQQVLSEAKSIIDKRLASQNLTEPEVRVQPASYSISVDMPGVANSSDVLHKIKDTVTVEYRLVQDKPTEKLNSLYLQDLETIKEMYRNDRIDPYEIKEILAEVARKAGLKDEDGRIFLYWRRGHRSNTPYLPREYRVLGPAVLDGSDMTNAQENPNADSGWYDINFVLSGVGANKFADITTQNQGRRLAILWGDRVVSDPRINGPIVGGYGVIQGDFAREDASEVANVIREGALPLPLEIISVSYVGPGLGQESIQTGVYSVLLGFILVNLFILLYYHGAGLVAVLALFSNLLIMAAILSLLEFTLTLPGFAGMILTVGMAVDANVIIFEKIREDLRSGKPPTVAIDSGFRSSFWTILDANVTTLIAAIILYYNGDGPIKGFAITLFFGLLSSLFTALYVSRVTFDWVYRPGTNLGLSIGWNVRGKKS